MKKLVLIIACLVLVVDCNSAPAPNTTESVEPSSQSLPSSSSEAPPSSLPAPKEESPFHTYEKYIEPFYYQLGRNSWDKYEDIEPDALAVFYVSLSAIGERESITSGPTDDHYGNFLMPADDVAQRVQKYFAFEIPREYLETSQYYDSEKDAYWTGGIGSVAIMQITDVKEQDGITTITCTATLDGRSSNPPKWTCAVTLRIAEDGFQYISYERSDD